MQLIDSIFFTALQGVVKRFFNEKEVTSTLVMDALFSGCKQLEETGRTFDSKKVKIISTSSPIVASVHSQVVQ